MSQQALLRGNSGLSAADEAVARTLILAQMHHYASMAREDADDSLKVPLFEPGVKINFPGGRAFAPSELGQMTAKSPPKILRHQITTADVQFASSTEASCQAFVIASTHIKPMDHWGTWETVFRKQDDGRWLIAKKTISLHGIDPEGVLALARAAREEK